MEVGRGWWTVALNLCVCSWVEDRVEDTQDGRHSALHQGVGPGASRKKQLRKEQWKQLRNSRKAPNAVDWWRVRAPGRA